MRYRVGNKGEWRQPRYLRLSLRAGPLLSRCPDPDDPKKRVVDQAEAFAGSATESREDAGGL